MIADISGALKAANNQDELIQEERDEQKDKRKLKDCKPGKDRERYLQHVALSQTDGRGGEAGPVYFSLHQ